MCELYDHDYDPFLDPQYEEQRLSLAVWFYILQRQFIDPTYEAPQYITDRCSDTLWFLYDSMTDQQKRDAYNGMFVCLKLIGLADDQLFNVRTRGDCAVMYKCFTQFPIQTIKEAIHETISCSRGD